VTLGAAGLVISCRPFLTNFMKNKKTVTIDDVLAWLGSDADLFEAAEIIASIANGDYNPKDLLEEVSDYAESNEE